MILNLYYKHVIAFLIIIINFVVAATIITKAKIIIDFNFKKNDWRLNYFIYFIKIAVIVKTQQQQQFIVIN